MGIYIDAFTTGVVALSIYGGAYASDAIRAGILAIDNGIIEAAEVSGLPRRVIFTRIVLPIALRTSVRPLGSVLINMILTSSILSTMHSVLVLAELGVDFTEPHAVLIPPQRPWWRVWS